MSSRRPLLLLLVPLLTLMTKPCAAAAAEIRAPAKAAGQSRAGTDGSFLAIGHSGGDPQNFCENTLESTRSAMQGDGINAVEIDISVSMDGVIFLWHDPEPLNVMYMARRYGYFLPGPCSPQMPLGDTAGKMTFQEIQSSWYYKDRESGERRPEQPPSLDQWLTEFSPDPRIQLIWLDIKSSMDAIPQLLASLSDLVSKHQLDPARLMLSASDDERVRYLIQTVPEYSLGQARIVADTVSYRPWVGEEFAQSPTYDGIARAQELGTCCASLGIPPLAFNQWSGLKRVVQANVEKRSQLGEAAVNSMDIFVWTVDNEEQMEWLVQSGVNGLITNKPRLLMDVISRASSSSSS